MPLAYYMACPVILINMGGEMVYILDQRLKAQNIEPEKAQRVLNDILKTLFSNQFLDQLFTPQKTFSLQFVKQLFDKVVHCSIMKLNETSMNKLLDLIFMGIKLQLFNSQSPCDMYFMTLNHISGVMNILQQGSSLDLLIKCKQMFIQAYSKMTPFDYIQIRAELTKFLAEKQVRVFMFMQEKLQNNDGSFIISNNNGPVAPFVGRPGFVQIFNEQGVSIKKKQLILKVGKTYEENDSKSFLEQSKTKWGLNLYGNDKSQKPLNEGKQIMAFQNDDQMRQALRINEQNAKQQMNQFASMIRNDNNQDDEEFTINVFSKQQRGSISNQNKNNDILDFNDEEFQCDIIVADSKQSGKEQVQTKIADKFNDLDIQEGEQQDQELDGDDLLDMMDNM